MHIDSDSNDLDDKKEEKKCILTIIIFFKYIWRIKKLFKCHATSLRKSPANSKNKSKSYIHGFRKS